MDVVTKVSFLRRKHGGTLPMSLSPESGSRFCDHDEGRTEGTRSDETVCSSDSTVPQKKKK